MANIFDATLIFLADDCVLDRIQAALPSELEGTMPSPTARGYRVARGPARLTYQFNTAGGPPDGWAADQIQAFPDAEVHYLWGDVGGSDCAGYVQAKGGSVRLAESTSSASTDPRFDTWLRMAELAGPPAGPIV